MKFNLFHKFSVSIIFIVLLFGLISILIVRNTVYNSLEKEHRKRGFFLAKTISEQALPYVLTDDYVVLNDLINNIISVDSTIYYAFILNSNGKVIAHSFYNDVPTELINANFVTDANRGQTVLIQEKSQETIILDFAFPLINKEIGTVRVGLFQNKIYPIINKTVYSLVIMIVFFIVIGILGAFLLSYIIVRPIQELSRRTESVDIETINAEIFLIEDLKNNLYFKLRKSFNSNDEIDVLFDRFIFMLKRLSHTYKEIQTMQSSMIHAEKMASMGTFTAGIAHEINNPLAGIQNCLNRIKRNQEDYKQTREYISLIEDALHKIENVIQQLLTFSRKQDADFRAENLCDILSGAINLAMLRYKDPKVEIFMPESNIDCTVLADFSRLQQVFTNIIFNAVDSINEKSKMVKNFKGKIIVSVSSEGNFMKIEFSDNGKGIEQKDIAHIFDPFFSTKEVGKGTGLGLSVAYQIIHDHKGAIYVESKQGEGATFYLKLPKIEQ